MQTPPSLRGPIVGLAEDRKGWLWIATTSHVLRVPRAALIAGDGVVSSGEVREYGVNEGLTSTNVVTRNHSVVSGPDGRVWVSSENGPSVVDPAQIGDTSAPALAHIEAITADGVPVELADSVRIPPSRKRITFAYTGLSLAEPGRIRFRYYLEGFDHGWSEPVAAREVAYTNIGPGKYRFHLIASNDEALWNAPEASTAMQVEPALWQTWWFRALCSSILVLGTVLLYLTRVQRLERQLNIRFEERLAERLRIARDLHDTLLQGVQGLTLRFNSAMQGVPPGTATRGSLEEALETAESGSALRRAIRSCGFAANISNTWILPDPLKKSASTSIVTVTWNFLYWKRVQYLLFNPWLRRSSSLSAGRPSPTHFCMQCLQSSR